MQPAAEFEPLCLELWNLRFITSPHLIAVIKNKHNKNGATIRQIGVASTNKVQEIRDFFRAFDYTDLTVQDAIGNVSPTTRVKAFPTKFHPTPNRNKLNIASHINNLVAPKILQRRFKILHFGNDAKQVFNEKPYIDLTYICRVHWCEPQLSVWRPHVPTQDAKRVVFLSSTHFLNLVSFPKGASKVHMWISEHYLHPCL